MVNKSIFSVRHFFLMCSLMLTACASVPDAPKIINESKREDAPLEIKVKEKIVTEEKAEKIIDKIAEASDADKLLGKHLSVEQSVSDKPLVAGNNVHLLFDGEQTFNAIFDAINSAQNHINLEYFIFENIKFKDTDLKTLLMNKSIQGVQVNIIYDSFGSSDTPKELFEEFKKNGIHVTEFNHLGFENIDKLNQRDHRKILVVDGKKAIVGGVNLSTTYQSKSNLGMRSKSPKNLADAHWRDTDMVIEGPAVAELQRLFMDHWDQTQPIDQTSFYPNIGNKGNELVRVMGSAPTKGLPLYYVTLVSAIENAENEIILSSAYFVPTPEQKKQLINAAKRGVQVNLCLPGISDSSLAMLVQHSHYEDLLESGINIFEMDDQVLHAKTVSIDGVWSVIGSSNFDYRSASTNQEVDVVVLGKETSTELKNKFNQDTVNAKKIELSAFKKRPFIQKIKEKFYRIFQSFL